MKWRRFVMAVGAIALLTLVQMPASAGGRRCGRSHSGGSVRTHSSGWGGGFGTGYGLGYYSGSNYNDYNPEIYRADNYVYRRSGNRGCGCQSTAHYNTCALYTPVRVYQYQAPQRARRQSVEVDVRVRVDGDESYSRRYRSDDDEDDCNECAEDGYDYRYPRGREDRDRYYRDRDSRDRRR